MSEKIYGIDLNQEINPLMARDALIKCFFEAHCADTEIGTEDPKANQEYIKEVVRKAFKDSGEDFEKPTQQSIVNAMGKLKEFSANFRDQSIIQKHATKMMKIVGKIKE